MRMVSKGFAGAPGASESLETVSAPPPTTPLRQGTAGFSRRNQVSARSPVRNGRSFPRRLPRRPQCQANASGGFSSTGRKCFPGLTKVPQKRQNWDKWKKSEVNACILKLGKCNLHRPPQISWCSLHTFSGGFRTRPVFSGPISLSGIEVSHGLPNSIIYIYNFEIIYI